jgi:hypothetical protein
MLKVLLFFGRPFLITGTLSPVSILSLTIAMPVNKIKSQGKTVFSGTSITSPGTNSELSI